MGREVERKYLVKNDHWRREADRGIEYRQGYLCLDPRRSVRVRLGCEKAVLAIKGQSEGSARDEFEFLMPLEDAKELLKRICIQPIINANLVKQPYSRWKQPVGT